MDKNKNKLIDSVLYWLLFFIIGFSFILLVPVSVIKSIDELSMFARFVIGFLYGIMCGGFSLLIIYYFKKTF